MEIKTERGENRIGIRVDANDTVATGHVMRCITIARQLIRLGGDVLFYTADAGAAELLGKAGMEYVCLNTRWDRMEEETAVLCEKLSETGCGKLLVDSYQVTAAYFEALKDCCKLIYIDDCFADMYPVDMIINYNAYHERFPYGEAYGGRTKLLLGTAYVPLREEFGGRVKDGEEHAAVCVKKQGAENGAEAHGKTEDKAGYGITFEETQENTDRNRMNVLLSSGGGDLCNALPGILAAAVKEECFRDVVFHTVVGGFNRNREELMDMAQRYPNIRLHERVDNMAQLMGQCGAAVSAAGTMLFELSAMQVPAVFFVSADNQQYDSEFFARQERMFFSGDIRRDRQQCLDNICAQLKRLIEDEGLRARMKKRLGEVTDAKGAQRIAEEIIKL